jgi:hypothetical protein
VHKVIVYRQERFFNGLPARLAALRRDMRATAPLAAAAAKQLIVCLFGCMLLSATRKSRCKLVAYDGDCPADQRYFLASTSKPHVLQPEIIGDGSDNLLLLHMAPTRACRVMQPEFVGVVALARGRVQLADFWHDVQRAFGEPNVSLMQAVTDSLLVSVRAPVPGPHWQPDTTLAKGLDALASLRPDLDRFEKSDRIGAWKLEHADRRILAACVVSDRVYALATGSTRWLPGLPGLPGLRDSSDDQGMQVTKGVPRAAVVSFLEFMTALRGRAAQPCTVTRVLTTQHVMREVDTSFSVLGAMCTKRWLADDLVHTLPLGSCEIRNHD